MPYGLVPAAQAVTLGAARAAFGIGTATTVTCDWLRFCVNMNVAPEALKSPDMQTAIANPRRAHRYEIHTDIRFRPTAVKNWHIGETENISDTGMLVRALEAVPINTPIQLELYTPAPLSGVAQMPVICNGRVVRTFHALNDRGLVRLAIEVQSTEVLPHSVSQHEGSADPQVVEAFHALTNQLSVVVGTAELLLATNHELDDVTAARLRKMKDVTLQAATTAKKLLT